MSEQISPKAFTVEYFGIVPALGTKCGVCMAFNPILQQGAPHPPVADCTAIWDTGAMGSVISEQLVLKLNLKPTGKARVFHANGESIVNTYSVNILLPNGVGIPSLPVTEGKLSDTDVLIGMDIISRGDFSITASQGKTKFSFQLPSTHNTDYVVENKQNKHK